MSSIRAQNETNEEYSIDISHQLPHGLPVCLFPSGLSGPQAASAIERLMGRSHKEILRKYETSTVIYRMLKSMRKHGATASGLPESVFVQLFYSARRNIIGIRDSEDADLPCLELSLLRRYHENYLASLDLNTAVVDCEAILQLFPWWSYFQITGLTMMLTRRIYPSAALRDKTCILGVQLLPALFRDLGRYAELDAEQQRMLAGTLFACATMFDVRHILDAAVLREPRLAGHLAWIDFSGSGPLPYEVPAKTILNRYHPKTSAALSPLFSIEDQLHRLSVVTQHFSDLLTVTDATGPARTTVRPTFLMEISTVFAIHDQLLASYDVVEKEARHYVTKTLDVVEQRISETSGELTQLAGEGLPVATIRPLIHSAQSLSLRDLGMADAFSTVLVHLASEDDSAYKEITRFGDEIEKVVARLDKLTEDPVRNANAIAETGKQIGLLRSQFETAYQAFGDTVRKTSAISSSGLAQPVPAPKPEPGTAKTTPVAPPTEQWVYDEHARLESELKGARDDLFKARQTIESLQQAGRDTPASALTPSENAAIFNLAMDKATVSDALTVASLQWPDHLLILPSAEQSAKAMDAFRNTRRLYEVLKQLVVDYRDLLIRGRPDAEARHVLGNIYHANESDTVMGSSRLRGYRTFKYRGKDVVMAQHLALGVSTDISTTIRVHFMWDAEERRIVIGYAGKHLPLS